MIFNQQSQFNHANNALNLIKQCALPKTTFVNMQELRRHKKKTAINDSLYI